MKLKSSFTSSSNWSRYVKTLIGTAVGTLVSLYLAVYLIDPYDVFTYSLQAERTPVSSTRRHFNPGIARQNAFDSIIIGTSSAMLLKPQRMNSMLDAKIANLSIPAASPYEQLRLADLFRHYHDDLNLVIVTIDLAWCQTEGAGYYLEVGDSQLEESRHIQEWMYATDFWSQLPPLNSRIVKDTRRQFSAIFRSREFEYGRDGYTDFTARYARKYTEAHIQKLLYGKSKKRRRQPIQPKAKIDQATIDGWRFPDLVTLRDWLGSLPTTTRKVLFFPPYHHYNGFLRGPKNEVLWPECKARVAKIGEAIPETTVIDFMFDSRVTLNDNNYWDSVHFKVGIANLLEDALGEVVMGSSGALAAEDKAKKDFYRVLVR